MKILVISSANMDLVLNMKKVPNAGQTITEDLGYAYVPGGKGANSALAFKRLGANTLFCACLGDDANGKALLSLYRDAGIDTSKVKISNDAPTGLATIMVEEDGANRIVVYPGTNLLLSESDVDRALECRPDAVFMQFEIPFDTVVYASRRAAELNIPVFIDAGPASKGLQLQKLARLVVFSPNETETKEFTGIFPDSESDCLRAVQALEGLVDAEYYVLKLGKRGAYIYNDGIGRLIPSFDVNTVDTTAAGDAFTAALTLEYLRTKDMEGAVRYANAVGAITVSRRGASTSIPNAEEVAAFLRERLQ